MQFTQFYLHLIYNDRGVNNKVVNCFGTVKLSWMHFHFTKCGRTTVSQCVVWKFCIICIDMVQKLCHAFHRHTSTKLNWFVAELCGVHFIIKIKSTVDSNETFQLHFKLLHTFHKLTFTSFSGIHKFLQ